MPGGVWFYAVKRSLRYLSLILKYSLLLVLLFFLAGHERANPKLGNTAIEFFSSDFRHGILLNIKNTEANSYDENLEKKLIYWFYSKRQFQPAWTINYQANNSYDDLITLLESATNYGLFSSLYKTDQLRAFYFKMINSSDDQERLDARIQLESSTTLAAFRFMIHLSTGLGNYDTTGVYLNFINNLPSYLNYHIEQKRIQQGILNVQPKSQEYLRLQNAWEKYIHVAAHDTMQCNTELFRKNNNLIAFKLVSQGYLNENLVSDSIAISDAIRILQRSHCIEETGFADQNTLHVLSISTMNKFYQVSLNLDRLRKDELKNRNSILVNIPEFCLHYYDKEGRNTSFKIIVGKKYTPTPILTSQVNRIIANPYWTVPKSITFDEIIPRIKRDSTYLQRNGFSLIDNYENPVNATSIDWSSINPGEFDYWIRQKNSRSNALGVVKFLFPNKYRVYLHDTQSKRLFQKNIRAYSHGCIRVQNPQELAQMILSTNTKPEKNIDFKDLMISKERHDIKLDEPISIFVRYYTCTADKEGNIYYHPDIYSRDGRELKELISNITRI